MRNVYDLKPAKKPMDLFDLLNTELLPSKFLKPFDVANDLFKTDISEKDGELVFEIEMPGVNKEDVSVELKDEFLQVSVEHKEENKDEENGKVIRTERNLISGTRRFHVGKVEEKDVSAKLENGILKVCVKKPELPEEEKKLIEIK